MSVVDFHVNHVSDLIEDELMDQDLDQDYARKLFLARLHEAVDALCREYNVPASEVPA